VLTEGAGYTTVEGGGGVTLQTQKDRGNLLGDKSRLKLTRRNCLRLAIGGEEGGHLGGSRESGSGETRRGFCSEGDG